ncbi:hypothetical protein ANCDUO_02836 [Ancylostoma duodenale]|uniref:Uncharacterized protein n=1 Tax=Ancylostoma duodenale TaxID=51022 RepID=A0A0C2GZC0_9BILA|nr:hypothetical protein ANCDUO_02836 [Ancylostoma duodenale]
MTTVGQESSAIGVHGMLSAKNRNTTDQMVRLLLNSFKGRYNALCDPRTDGIHWTTLTRETDERKDRWRPFGISEDQPGVKFDAPSHLNDLIDCLIPSTINVESVAYASEAKKLIIVVDKQTTKYVGLRVLKNAYTVTDLNYS